MGNQGFIRATKFMGLVAGFLKQGQPGFFFFISLTEYADIFFIIITIIINHCFLLLLGCLK